LEYIKHYFDILWTDLFPNHIPGGDRARKVEIGGSSLTYKIDLTHGRVVAIYNEYAEYLPVVMDVQISQFCVVSSPTWADIIEGGGPLQENELLVAMIGETPVLLDLAEDYDLIRNNPHKKDLWIFVNRDRQVRCAYEKELVEMTRGEAVLGYIGKVAGKQKLRDDGKFFFQDVEGGVKTIINDGAIQQLQHRISEKIQGAMQKKIDWIEKLVQAMLIVLLAMLAYQVYSSSQHISAPTHRRILNPVMAKNITAEQKMLRDLISMRKLAKQGQPLEAFKASITMTRNHAVSQKEYICRADIANPMDGKLHYHQSAYKQANQTLLNYLLEQPDNVTCRDVPEVVCNQTVKWNLDWQYRLALYMVQRNTWKFIGKDYDRYLLYLPSEATESKGPTCFNPITIYNFSLLTSAERRWEHLLDSVKGNPTNTEDTLQVGINDPNLVKMKNAMVINLDHYIKNKFQMEKGIVVDEIEE
jgi:hypothetical protein